MKTITEKNALQNFYTEYIIDFVLEVSLIIGGWIALLISGFSVEITEVITTTASEIANNTALTNQNNTVSFDLWLERISKIVAIILPIASFVIVLFRKKKNK